MASGQPQSGALASSALERGLVVPALGWVKVDALPALLLVRRGW